MRKSFVLALVLAMMFLLGTSNAGAGSAPIWQDCTCFSECLGGVSATVLYGCVLNDSPDFVDVYDTSFYSPLLGTFGLYPVSQELDSGEDHCFLHTEVEGDWVYGLPAGEHPTLCQGYYNFLPDGDGVGIQNNGTYFQYDEGTCEVPVCDIEAYVDIKPQSCPNPLRTKSKGVLPVAILTAPDFDATTVDPDTVALGRADGVGGTVPALEKPEPYIEDVETPVFLDECDCSEGEPDGALDLTVKFSIQDFLAVADGDFQDGDVVELQVTGNLYPEFGGTPFVGSDCVVIRAK